jgi:two-component system chemotaxis response regulator CheB
VVALAASTGGLAAHTAVLAPLPVDFAAAIVLVQHLEASHRSLLAEILGRRTSLVVREAVEGDRIVPGGVWVTPPDLHLVLNGDGTLSLTRTARIHFLRPSADPTFISMALAYGDRAIAVVLTGKGVDGEAGVRAVKGMGGTVLAQDRATSKTFGMPGAAIATGCVDSILPLAAIAPALIELVMQ